MPRKAKSVCPTSGCPALTDGGRCDDCKRQAEQRRGTAAQRGYDSRWERTRKAYLRTHPLCECDTCLALPPHDRPAATDVDHIDGLGPKGPQGHDPSNLRAMAHSHHSRSTAERQPGGWNAR